MNLETSFAPLLDLLLKSAALLLIGGALLTTLRKTSAANRHAVFVAILATLLLLPLTKLIAPRWSLAMEPDQAATTGVNLPAVASIKTTPSVVLVVSSKTSVAPLPSTPWVIPWKTLFVATWIGGTVLLLGRRAYISLRLRALAHRSLPIQDERLAAFTRKLTEASGTRAAVRVSTLCRVPLVAGIVRPIVLLPVDASEWSEPRIAFALCHELGHIRRRDCLTRLLAEIACALYWLNPLVWLAARQMRLAQEQACDDLVLNSGAPADEYAEQLVDAVRSLQADHFASRHALAMAQPSTLETRVVAIMDPTRDRSPRSGRGALGGVAFVAMMLTFCAAAQLRGAQEAASPTRESADAKAGAAQAVQVIIEARFIEIPMDPTGLPDLLKAPGPTSVPSERAEAAIKGLQLTKGVTILATPRLTTKSGQKAKIEIGREYRYVTDWEKDPKTAAWEAKAFGTENLGTTFEVTPKVNADGVIDLELLPAIKELTDVVDLDAPQAGAKPDVGRVIPEGHRSQPVFTHRNMETHVKIKSGDTVAFGGLDTSSGRLIVLVTARVAVPGAIPAHPAVKGADTLESTPVNKSGANGDVITDSEDAIRTRVFGTPTDTPKKTDAPATPGLAPGAAAKAEWVYPKIDFREATVKEVAEYLVKTSAQLDPKRKGANIVIKEGRDFAEAKITLKLANVPLEEVLKYVASLANAEMVKEEFAFVIQPIGATERVPGLAGGGAPANVKPNLAPVPAPHEKGAAWKKAQRIIPPRIDFRSASAEECIDFLRTKARELDPDKLGVNLVLHPDPNRKLPPITLSLINTPLSEVLLYVANLSSLQVVSDDHAITLSPLPK
jgi:beta-lactamase regulating signal transducer with metallopeptidase domain